MRDTSFQNLSDLDFDLSMSLQVKSNGAGEASEALKFQIPKYFYFNDIDIGTAACVRRRFATSNNV